VNDLDILDAMAAHLEALTPPTGYAVRNVYATPPDAIAVVPSIVLLPGSDSISYGAGNRTTTLTVSVVAYLQPAGGFERKYRDLFEFRSWLRDSFRTGLTLSGASVQVSVTGTALGTDTWADQDYLTCTATTEVTVAEIVAFTA